MTEPEGLVSSPRFSIVFEKLFLGGQSLCVLSEKKKIHVDVRQADLYRLHVAMCTRPFRPKQAGRN